MTSIKWSTVDKAKQMAILLDAAKAVAASPADTLTSSEASRLMTVSTRKVLAVADAKFVATAIRQVGDLLVNHCRTHYTFPNDRREAMTFLDHDEEAEAIKAAAAPKALAKAAPKAKSTKKNEVEAFDKIYYETNFIAQCAKWLGLGESSLLP